MWKLSVITNKWDVVAHWKRTRLLGQRFRARIRHLPQRSWCAAGLLCNNVKLRVERGTYPWGKKRSWKKSRLNPDPGLKVLVQIFSFSQIYLFGRDRPGQRVEKARSLHFGGRGRLPQPSSIQYILGPRPLQISDIAFLIAITMQKKNFLFKAEKKFRSL